MKKGTRVTVRNGKGVIADTMETLHGQKKYLVKGANFSKWYNESEVQKGD